MSLKLNEIHLGDCLELMPKIPDGSIDSCVTDPPYGLSFMGKKWDYDVPSVKIWREVFRVLKPGAHILSFGGTRTYHRMVVNIEDAGFEIRDQLQWLYGSGFPKSHDISKAIDKEAGAKRNKVGSGKGRTGQKAQPHGGSNFSDDGYQWPGEYEIMAPATDDAKKWEGFGTALKPANEPICLARKPLSEKTIAKNVLEHGTGALNIDGCRITIQEGDVKQATAGWDGFPIPNQEETEENGKGAYVAGTGRLFIDQGRWPANVILDEEAGEILDAQSGELSTVGGPKKTTHTSGMFGIGTPGRIYKDEGGASRFFYCAKAAKRERNAGIEDGNTHPTVKPVDLMRYLVRLITPPGGVVLEPFLGSGSTAIAAVLEGFDFIGIEQNPDYCEIARKRIRQSAEDAEIERKRIKAVKKYGLKIGGKMLSDNNKPKPKIKGFGFFENNKN